MNTIAKSVFDHLDTSMPFVKNNTILLCRAGSMSYGTNVADSDEDFRGVCTGQKKHYFGNDVFEQAEIRKPDTTIFEIRKFFKLAMAANPNIIETLFVDPCDQIIVDPLGEILLEHRNEFLSKRIKFTFAGYAKSQLQRIKLHRRYLMNPPKINPSRKETGLPEQTLIPQDQLLAAEAAINKEMDRFQFDFLEGLEESTKIGIRNTMAEMLAELEITAEQHWMAAARKIGLSDNLIEVMQKERQYATAKREWDQYQSWKKTRNPARAALEEKFGFDTKHAYHLVRLTRMAEEAQTSGKIIVKRVHDREELLSIRNGAWNFDQLMDFADKAKTRLDFLYKNSNVLPDLPNKEKLDKLLVELVEMSLSQYSWYNIRKRLNTFVSGL